MGCLLMFQNDPERPEQALLLERVGYSLLVAHSSVGLWVAAVATHRGPRRCGVAFNI